MARVEDQLLKMMMRCDSSDEYHRVERLFREYWEKVDAHAISIKHLEFQMAKLSSIVNPRQPGTLPINIIQNLKNNGHCMAVTTRGGNQTIDPPMSSDVEDEMRGDYVVEEVSGEFVWGLRITKSFQRNVPILN